MEQLERVYVLAGMHLVYVALPAAGMYKRIYGELARAVFRTDFLIYFQPYHSLQYLLNHIHKNSLRK